MVGGYLQVSRGWFGFGFGSVLSFCKAVLIRGKGADQKSGRVGSTPKPLAITAGPEAEPYPTLSSESCLETEL